MADLYGTNGRSSSINSEEMSSFLHNLLHNSSATSPPPPPPPSSTSKAKQRHSFSSPPPRPPVAEAAASTAGLVRIGVGASTAVVDSRSNLDFSDPSGFFPINAKESLESSFSSAAVADSGAIVSSMNRRNFPRNDVENFDFDRKEPEASEVPVNPVLSRSSKRARAAEIHNLSEKRRRCRINEKLKALQNLIPNSNKSDKASMLDEAIEYLKQLQLKVQMLTVRNGISLLPVNLPETIQPMQLPLGNGLLNANGGNTFSENQEISTRTALYMSNHSHRSQPNVIPSLTNIPNSETSFGLEPSIQNHYGLLSHSTFSKEICQVYSPSQLQLDISFSAKNSSPGVS